MRFVFKCHAVASDRAGSQGLLEIMSARDLNFTDSYRIAGVKMIGSARTRADSLNFIPKSIWRRPRWAWPNGAMTGWLPISRRPVP
jgi:hypothetical protein